MTARELKDKFVAFFEHRGHKIVPPAPLVPENDPSTLFISAGIQPLVPYFLGKQHPYGKRLVNVQKCVRTGDIDEVGDAFHHTFFEMLGNWSLGDYFNKEMIPWSFEFLTKELGLSSDSLAVSCFKGGKGLPKDEVSAVLWKEQGISRNKIAFLTGNWWGPPGVTGPCGADTEMFYWTGSVTAPARFDPQDSRWVEIWNDVLIQYYKDDRGGYQKLVQDNIDTGMGVERTVAVLNGLSDNYLTTIWQPIIKTIEDLSGLEYTSTSNQRAMRIIADHVRAAVFILADGVEPGNKERGYVLRRLIRRAVRQGEILSLAPPFTSKIAEAVMGSLDNYAGEYPELIGQKERILKEIETEENKFRQTLARGLKKIRQLIDEKRDLSGEAVFDIYQTYGFPVEMVTEELSRYHLSFDIKDYNRVKEEHINKSRRLSAGMFKAGLADDSDITTRYHTATHLLHQALRIVLGDHVHQAGSNITKERLRFDFTHSEKLTDQQLRVVGEMINQKITENLPVNREEMDKDEALGQGALAFFPEKYPQVVSVYTIGDKNNWFSKELCSGPHVNFTGEIGNIEIIKQESCGNNVRRLYLKLK